MKPQRIRLSRKKGFKLAVASALTNGLPAINCARPGLFGNPFPVGKFNGFTRTPEDAVRLFTEWLDGGWPDIEPQRRDQVLLNLWRLRDHNGACYCQLHQPCHVEVLLNAAARLKK